MIDQLKASFQRLWPPLTLAVVAGLVTHFLFYANGLVNPDAINAGEQSISGAWEISLGRWMLPLWDRLRFGINAYHLIAFMAITLLALAGILLCDVFGMHSRIKAFLVCASLTCSPFVGASFTYIYCADAYAFSAVLAVASVYFVVRQSRQWLGLLLGTLCATVATGIYQAASGMVLATAAGYVLLCLLRTPDQAKAHLRVGLRLAAVWVVSMLLYFALTKTIQWLTGVSMSSFRGADGVSILSVLRNLPQGVVKAYRKFGAYFFKQHIARNAYGEIYLYIGLFGLGMLSACRQLFRLRKQPLVVVACVVLALVYPLCCNVINIIVPQTDTYLLMVFGMLVVVPLLLALTTKAIGKATAVLTGALIWAFVLTNQTDATVLLMDKNQTVQVARDIWQDVRTSDLYQRDETTLLIAGKPCDGNYPNPSVLAEKANYHAKYCISWSHYIYNLSNWQQLYRTQLGITYQTCTDEQFKQIAESEAYAQMPMYPDDGAIAMIDGILVVKISETDDWYL